MDPFTAIVGYTTEAIKDAKEYIPTPAAPANYKDPIKIAEYEERAMAAALEEASRKPLTGRLSQVSIWSFQQEKPVIVSGWPDVPVLSLLNAYSRIFVIDIGAFLRLARVEYIARVGRLTPDVAWSTPAIMNGYAPGTKKVILNPIWELVESNAEGSKNLELVMRRFNMQWGTYAPYSAEGLGYVTLQAAMYFSAQV